MNANDKFTQISPQEFRRQFTVLIDGSKFKQALALATNALKNDPVQIDYHLACACSLTELRRFKKARKFIESAQRINPVSEALALVRANWYMRQNEFEESERILLAHCDRQQNVDSLLELCRLYKTMYSVYRFRFFKLPGRKKKTAEKYFSAADKIGTQYGCVLLAAKLKASFCLENKLKTPAHEYLANAIASDPADPWAYFRKAYLFLRSGKNATAKKLVQDGLMLKPDDEFGLYLWAYIKANGDKDKFLINISLLRIIVIIAAIGIAYLIKVGIAAYIIIFAANVFFDRRVKRELKKLTTIELRAF